MGSGKPETIKPSPCLAGMRSYCVPKSGAPVDLKLDANEGAPVSAAVLNAFETTPPEVIRSYPKAANLEVLVAGRFGVDPDRVIITAGGDDAINRLCRAVLSPGREVVVPEPTFEMIAHFGKMAGAKVVSVLWEKGPYPTDEVIKAVGKETALISVVSPNNPTGCVVAPKDIERLCEAAPGAVVLFDFAYVEFADEDPTQAALKFPNALVVRTLSKAYGMAGMRVGYAIGSAQVIEWMRVAGGPYGVTGPSLMAAEARLQSDASDVETFIDCVRRERGKMQSLLGRLNMGVNQSQGNFVFAHCSDPAWVRDALAGLGISIRIFPGANHLANALRITCPGDDSRYGRLEHALRAALDPEALLLDMDGVLADVSQSYRRTIIATADAFGVTLEQDEVTRAKVEGLSNNDWILTRLMMKRKGVHASLADVTRTFEKIYQGTEEDPGLRRCEDLLIERSTLERLARRLKIGVVTGRPRGDAERFLREKGIGDLVSVVVCMGETEAKPSPEPVRLAMEKLGANRAWMVGDTADDVRAAREAGVIPLGVAAPGDEWVETESILVKAGAARVLSDFGDLEDLLP